MIDAPQKKLEMTEPESDLQALTFGIQGVDIVQLPDFDAPLPDHSTIISATKPGFRIAFESSEQAKRFSHHYRDIIGTVPADQQIIKDLLEHIIVNPDMEAKTTLDVITNDLNAAAEFLKAFRLVFINNSLHF